eukprot:jgi/Botrbrau1/19533/Bobra.0035s0028.1
MSKAWSLSAISKSVSQAAAENAARLRQAMAERTPTSVEGSSTDASVPSSSEEKSDQLIRLPREAAYKLKWFDGGDASALIETHTREKLQLQNTIAALKKELVKALGEEQAAGLEEQVTQLLEQAERQQRVDDGVASVLLLAARRQMETKAKDQEEQLQELQEQLQEQIHRLEAQLEEAKEQCSRQAAEVDRLVAAQEAAAASAGRPDADPAAGSADAAALRAEVLRAKSGAVEREAELQRAKAAALDSEAQLVEAAGRAAEHEAELAGLQQQLRVREAEVLELKAEVAQRDAELRRVEGEAEERGAELVVLRTEAAERGLEAEQARELAARAADEVAQLREQLQVQADEINELRQRLVHLEPAPCPGTPTAVPTRQPFRSLGTERRGGLSVCSSEDGGQEPLEDRAGPSEAPVEADLLQGGADDGQQTLYRGGSGTLNQTGELLTMRSNELYAENGTASLEPSPEKMVGLRHMDSHVRGHMDAAVAHHAHHSNGWASQALEGEESVFADVARELAAEQDASHALLGKLQAVEQERLQQQEEINRLQQRVMDLEKAVEEALKEKAAMSDKLESSGAEMEAERRGFEERIAELKEHIDRQSQRHRERLQEATGIVVSMEQNAATLQETARAEAARAEEAISRASRFEAELRDVRSEIRRLTSDVKAKERERDRAEARATQAETAVAEARQRGASEAEKGGALSSALASQRKLADEREAQLRQQMREMEASLRARISKLDNDNQDLRRNVARAGVEADALEKKVGELEAANGSLQCDLREAEMAAADRDEFAARVQALEERLQETRSQYEVLSTYKQIAAEQEAGKIRAQEEVVATARVATSLEQRLREAMASRDHAQEAAVIAQRRVQEVEESIKREVKRRLDAIGADEQQWPRAAREEVARLQKHVEALSSLKATVQKELEDVTRDWESELSAKATLEVRLTAAEQKYEREKRESGDSLAKLERALAQARSEAAEWRREASAAEAERDKLQASLHRSRASPASPPSRSAVSTRRGGGGLLGSVDEETAMMGQREEIKGVDIVYFKNVMLKFLEANSSGRTDQCDILLPAVATLLKADPEEYRRIKRSIAGQPVHAINNLARGWLSSA